MEEQKVLLSVRGRQTYGDQEQDTIELVTEGTMVFRDGGWDISYEETALTGMEGVTTTFRVEPGKVTLLRTGKLNSTMVFQENVAHDSLYQLESWYHPEQVMAQAVLLVSGRTYEDGGVSLEDEVSYLNKKYGADIRILHNPKIEEASADIRKRAALGEDLSKDTPEAVANYIRDTGLYRK